MLLSICENNYAYYDRKENKICIGYDNKTASISVPKGKTINDICITEDYLCFILDKTHLVRGNLRQNLNKPEFRSVDTLPRGRSWSRILYISKTDVKKIVLISQDNNGENFEIFYELGSADFPSGHFINVTPNKTTIVDKLPENDFDSTAYVSTSNYIGMYDNTKHTFVWQKVELSQNKIYSITFGKNSVFFTDIIGTDIIGTDIIGVHNEEVPLMALKRADLKKLLKGEPDSVETIEESCIILSMHTFNDALVVVDFTNQMVMYKNVDGEYKMFVYNQWVCLLGKPRKVKVDEVDEDDILLFLTGCKNNVLYKTAKGRVFKVCFKEDLSGLKSIREVSSLFEKKEQVDIQN
uniref:Uncharacterized protein n=1 Tax=viral metagenome TaxID=1070528 RepID=A0A6C0KU14_9ZZZZ